FRHRRGAGRKDGQATLAPRVRRGPRGAHGRALALRARARRPGYRGDSPCTPRPRGGGDGGGRARGHGRSARPHGRQGRTGRGLGGPAGGDWHHGRGVGSPHPQATRLSPQGDRHPRPRRLLRPALDPVPEGRGRGLYQARIPRPLVSCPRRGRPAPLSRILRPARVRTEVDRRRPPRPAARSRMSSRARRLASGVLALILVAWLDVEAASGAAIRGAILNAGPPPPRKQIPINIDQYVCGKSKESEELVVGPNRGIQWAVVSLQSPPPGSRTE